MTTMPFADSVKNGLFAAGWYANRLAHDRFPGVVGLCYHGIRPASTDERTLPFAHLHVIEEDFDAQCRMIAECCHPIDLATFRDARTLGRPLPERPVLVTFDDGYRSVFELARPILRRHGIPATVFVCTDAVRRQQLFWFDAVARALGPAAATELRSRPAEEWRKAAAAHETPAADAPGLAPMTDAQVRQLADEGFAIGVHTASHARLAGAPLDVQRVEIDSCRAALDSWTGRPVDSIAYPFGGPGVDYGADTVALAAELGFTTGFTTRSDFARPDEPALERSRFVVLAAVTDVELCHRMAYAWPRTERSS